MSLVHDLRPAWIRCTKCGVTQPMASIGFAQGGHLFVCTDEARCKRYQAELKVELKQLAIADPVLFTRRDDETLAEVHGEKPFKTVTTYAFPPDHK